MNGPQKWIRIITQMLFIWIFKRLLIPCHIRDRLCKLKKINIRNDLINWIEAFITNRRQKVAVNGKESKWHKVTSGIPQGSVLGSLLFVLYVNDLPDLTKSNTFLFADDIKIFRAITNKMTRIYYNKT